MWFHKHTHQHPVPSGGLLTAGVGAALGVGKVNSKINTIANVVNSKANLLNFKTNLVNTGINGANFVSSSEWLIILLFILSFSPDISPPHFIPLIWNLTSPDLLALLCS